MHESFLRRRLSISVHEATRAALDSGDASETWIVQGEGDVVAGKKLKKAEPKIVEKRDERISENNKIAPFLSMTQTLTDKRCPNMAYRSSYRAPSEFQSHLRE